MSKIRESTGGAFERRGAFFIRVTIAPGKRLSERAPWATNIEQADARAKVVQGWVNRLRAAGHDEFVKTIVEFAAKADDAKMAEYAAKVDALVGGDFDRIEPAKKQGGPLTFRTFAERWTSGELARLYPDHIEPKESVRDDIERLEKHVYPHVEDVPLVMFTREHADGVMARVPSTLKRGTRRQVAQLINRVLRLAVFAQEIKASPLPPGWLPRAPKADSIAKESLLPSEEAKLLRGTNSGGETVVPLNYRGVYAFLHREGMRKGEARRLTWGDLDLEKGIVSLDENKTDRPRSWVLDEGVLAMLKEWRRVAANPKTTEPAFTGINWPLLAATYRSHCEAVGIDRARLFQRKANKLRLRAHDMRAFFITSGMFSGKDALWITDRSGHTTLTMLRTYERDVRRWRELGEAPVAADLAIPEIAAAIAAAEHGGTAVVQPGASPISPSNPAGFRRRDSNPNKRNQKPSKSEAPSTIPQDSAASESAASRDDASSGVLPPRNAAASEPTDAELERGILDALGKGLDAVAKTLAEQLRERQRQRQSSKVIDLESRRRDGR